MTFDVKLSHYFLLINRNVFWTLKSFRKQFQSTMKYEWTPSHILFCGYCVLELFCHNMEGPRKCSQKCELEFWNFKFWKLEVLPEAVIQSFSVKKLFLKILQDSQENPCSRALVQVLSCEHCEIFNNTFFYKL